MTLPYIFAAILRMSAVASLVALAVFALNWPLKRLKAPALLVCALWLVVLARLLLPVTFSSAFSLLSAPPLQQPLYMLESLSEQAQPEQALPAAINIPSATPAAQFTPAQLPPTNETLPPGFTVPTDETARFQPLAVLPWVWAGGALCLLLYGAVSYLLLKRRLRTVMLIEGNIYESEHISGPFVCGLFAPRIYLPLALAAGERAYIISHEQIHIRRRDHLLKPLWYLACCLHWFNPLAWLAFRQMSRDMELSCDEAVLRELGESVKADYSGSLLALAGRRQEWGFSPLAFGENNTKERVRRVLEYKKPVWWLALLAALAVIICAVVLLADPRDQVEPDGEAALAAIDQRELMRLRDSVDSVGFYTPAEGRTLFNTQNSYPAGGGLHEQLLPLLATGRSMDELTMNNVPPVEDYLRLSVTFPHGFGSRSYYVYELDGRYFIDHPAVSLRETNAETYQAILDIYAQAQSMPNPVYVLQPNAADNPYYYSFTRHGDYLTSAVHRLTEPEERNLAEAASTQYRAASTTLPPLSWDDIPQEELYSLAITRPGDEGTEWYLIYRYHGQLYIQLGYDGWRAQLPEFLLDQLSGLLTDADILLSQEDWRWSVFTHTLGAMLARQALLEQGLADPEQKALQWYTQQGYAQEDTIMLTRENESGEAIITDLTYGTGVDYMEGILCFVPEYQGFSENSGGEYEWCQKATGDVCYAYFIINAQQELSIKDVDGFNMTATFGQNEAGRFHIPLMEFNYPHYSISTPIAFHHTQESGMSAEDEEAMRQEAERWLEHFMRMTYGE